MTVLPIDGGDDCVIARELVPRDRADELLLFTLCRQLRQQEDNLSGNPGQVVGYLNGKNLVLKLREV